MLPLIVCGGAPSSPSCLAGDGPVAGVVAAAAAAPAAPATALPTRNLRRSNFSWAIGRLRSGAEDGPGASGLNFDEQRSRRECFIRRRKRLRHRSHHEERAIAG